MGGEIGIRKHRTRTRAPQILIFDSSFPLSLRFDLEPIISSLFQDQNLMKRLPIRKWSPAWTGTIRSRLVLAFHIILLVQARKNTHTFLLLFDVATEMMLTTNIILSLAFLSVTFAANNFVGLTASNAIGGRSPYTCRTQAQVSFTASFLRSAHDHW